MHGHQRFQFNLHVEPVPLPDGATVWLKGLKPTYMPMISFEIYVDLSKKHAQLFKDVYTAQSVVSNLSLVLWAVGAPCAALALGLLAKARVYDPWRNKKKQAEAEADEEEGASKSAGASDIAGMAQA